MRDSSENERSVKNCVNTYNDVADDEIVTLIIWENLPESNFFVILSSEIIKNVVPFACVLECINKILTGTQLLSEGFSLRANTNKGISFSRSSLPPFLPFEFLSFHRNALALFPGKPQQIRATCDPAATFQLIAHIFFALSSSFRLSRP